MLNLGERGMPDSTLIIHAPASGFDEQLARERQIIRRYQTERAGELQALRGIRRLYRRIQIYWWARNQAIPEIIAERKRRGKAWRDRRHWV